MKQLWSPELYLKAWNFASKAHKGQMLSGSSVPYITHVGNVAMEVMTAIALSPVDNPDLGVQCALLHDVIEDTPTDIRKIEIKFGQDVAKGVEALSKNPHLPTKAAKMDDSLKRIMKQPREIRMVKLADRITNLQSPPPHWTKAKIEFYYEESIKIYEKLHHAHQALSRRLAKKIENYRIFF